MKKSISLIWGTPIDTQFWVKFLQTLWYTNIYSYNISKDPEAQNELQFHNTKLLQDICTKKIQEFKENWCKICIIYCNSLSSVLNIQELEREWSIEVISPINIYRTLQSRYRRITIISANANGAQLIERELSRLHCLSIWWLELVSHIEQQWDPKKILQILWLKNIIALSQKLEHELILLWCTHFPYITKELQKVSPIPILDLNQGFRNLLEK